MHRACRYIAWLLPCVCKDSLAAARSSPGLASPLAVCNATGWARTCLQNTHVHASHTLLARTAFEQAGPPCQLPLPALSLIDVQHVQTTMCASFPKSSPFHPLKGMLQPILATSKAEIRHRAAPWTSTRAMVLLFFLKTEGHTS